MRLAQVPLAAVKGAMRDLGIERVPLSSVARHLDFAILRLIDLARALASNPQILMLDEITAALPADLSERVFSAVRNWRQRGSSVIFISHRLAEVAALCDRATVLRDGVTVGVTATRGAQETIVNLMLGPTSPNQSWRRSSVRRRRRSGRGCRRSKSGPCPRPCAARRLFSRGAR
jgi:ribose transport system ATP-binding protein